MNGLLIYAAAAVEKAIDHLSYSAALERTVPLPSQACYYPAPRRPPFRRSARSLHRSQVCPPHSGAIQPLYVLYVNVLLQRNACIPTTRHRSHHDAAVRHDLPPVDNLRGCMIHVQ